MDPSAPRVAVVAPELLARAGLAALLEEAEDLALLGSFDAGSSRIARTAVLLEADALLLDLGAGGRLEPQALAAWAELELPMLALVADAAAAAQARAAGAGAILDRERPAEAVLAALRALLAGLEVRDPLLGAKTLGFGLDSVDRPPLESMEPLTPREREVLQWVARGLTNAAVAGKLGISPNTVKFHLNASMAKLDAGSRTEAVVRAARLGWIAL